VRCTVTHSGVLDKPMPLVRVPEPFNHRDWLFELKHDGFRGLEHIAGRRCRLLSRRGHVFPIAQGCPLPLAAFVGNDATLHESTLASGTRHAGALDAPRGWRRDAARLALYLP